MYSFNTDVSNMENGSYEVCIISAEGNESFDVVIVDTESIENALQQINKATAETEFCDIVRSNTENLGIDTTIYSAVGDDINKILYATKPQGGFKNAAEFNKYLNNAIAEALIANGNDIKTVLDTYKTTVGTDYDKEIAVCGDKVVKELVRLISNRGSEKAPLCDIIKKQRLMAAVNVSETYGEMKLAILGTDRNGNEYADNFAVLAADTTYYDKLAKEAKENLVYMDLFAEKSTINSVETLRKRFEEISKIKYDETKQNTSGAGSSGSSGSSGGSSQIKADANYGAPAVPEKDAPQFGDIQNHWAKDSVNELCEKGVISGFPDGTFKPDNQVTRAEFVKMLTQAFKITGVKKVYFSDVTYGDWYFECVAAAAENGILYGEDGRFKPDEYITREDAAVMLYRYLKNAGLADDGKAEFADGGEISEYAVPAVGALGAAKIINGVGDGRFEPKGVTTRAQAAVLILNALGHVPA